MITDASLRVSEAQAITATAVSSSSIDLVTSGVGDTLSPRIGQGNNLVAVITRTEAFNTLTSLTIEIILDSTANLATAPVVIGTSGAIPLATLLLDEAIIVGFSQNPENTDPTAGTYRYMGLRYTVVGSAPTTGKVTADFVETAQGRTDPYPSRFAVLESPPMLAAITLPDDRVWASAGAVLVDLLELFDPRLQLCQAFVVAQINSTERPHPLADEPDPTPVYLLNITIDDKKRTFAVATQSADTPVILDVVAVFDLYRLGAERLRRQLQAIVKLVEGERLPVLGMLEADRIEGEMQHRCELCAVCLSS